MNAMLIQKEKSDAEKLICDITQSTMKDVIDVDVLKNYCFSMVNLLIHFMTTENNDADHISIENFLVKIIREGKIWHKSIRQMAFNFLKRSIGRMTDQTKEAVSNFEKNIDNVEIIISASRH